MSGAASATARLRRSDVLAASAVIALAAAVRILYLAERASDPSIRFPSLDARFHDLWAQSILNGSLLGDAVFFRAPLYPYLLALLYSVAGHDTFLPLVVQAIAGVAGVAAVMVIARRLGGGLAAAAAGLLAAVHAPMVFFEGELLLDAPLAAAVAVWLAVLPGRLGDRTWKGPAVAGAVTGLLALMRPPFLPVGVALCALLLAQGGLTAARARRLAVVCGGAALVLLPVTLRNALVGGEFVPIAAQGGINFYIGNNPEADGATSSVPEAGGIYWSPVRTRAAAAAKLGRVPGPAEESRFWYARGLHFLTEHPAKALELTFRKTAFLIQREEIPNNRGFATAAGDSPVLGALPGGFWLLAPAGITGIALLARRRAGPQGRAVIWFAVLYGFVTVAFFVCDRFRLPLVPVFAVGAGVAVEAAVEHVRRRRWRALAAGTACAAGLAAFVHQDRTTGSGPAEAREYLRRAGIALGGGKDSAAAEWLMRAEETGAALPFVQVNLGVLALRRGDTTAADAHFREELRRFPETFAAEANLGILDMERGDAESALERFTRAARLRPDREEGYVGAAAVLLGRGEALRADSVLRSRPRYAGPPSPRMEFMRIGIGLRCGTPLSSADSALGALLTRAGRPVQPGYAPEDWEPAELRTEDMRVLAGEIWSRRGHIAVARGSMEDAERMFGRAVEADSSNPEGWADRGLALVYLGRVGESVVVLEEGVRRHPLVPGVWHNYAVALGRAGRTDEAGRAMTRARLLAEGGAP